MELLPFTAASADRYARVRAQHRVAPADAVHLAAASQAGVELFLTNDRHLQGLVVEGIGFVAAMDVDLF